MQNLDDTISSKTENDDSIDFQGDTQQSTPVQDTSETPEPGDISPNGKRKPWLRRIILGIIIFIVIVGLSGLSGYFVAVSERKNQYKMDVATQIADQFLLGLIDMEKGYYENAIERFEFIIREDPNHIYAQEKLREAIMALGSTGGLPSLIPEDATTPTPDMRNEQELLTQAILYRNAGDWDALLTTLDSLRKANPDYQAVEVDGLYYIAFRNRGLYRIQVEGNLEGGIFDINRSELFGPIDVEASNFREWSEWYIIGVSYWELDWEQAVYYFGNVAASAPNLSDSSYFTAQSRLATAQSFYALEMVTDARTHYSRGRYCDAYDLYKEASKYISLDDDDKARYEQARIICLDIPDTPTPTPEGGSPPTSTPTP